MALLHCPHSKKDTGKIFYQVLQGGGVEAHGEIAASDKDIRPCFIRMGKLVTTELIKLYAAIGGGENKYNEEEMQNMADYVTGEMEDEDTEQEFIENWLDNIFNIESKISWEKWVELVDKKECSWIYNPKKLREKIFKGAKIDYRYK